ncbi:unnamed protein product [Trichobilharzia regenti]|nr:unnamed protein product [Trichobilharzia regenti]
MKVLVKQISNVMIIKMAHVLSLIGQQNLEHILSMLNMLINQYQEVLLLCISVENLRLE